jgi:transposase
LLALLAYAVNARIHWKHLGVFVDRANNWNGGRTAVFENVTRFPGGRGEDTVMLPEPSVPSWLEIDLAIFAQLIPSDHYVRKALNSIDFERFRAITAPYYSPDHGRPAEDPVRMVKLGFLQYHDRLSDAQVVGRAKTDVAYRYFLGLSLTDELPDPSSLCVFRGRLGVEGYRGIFAEVVSQAREFGLVKDRLRLKDATHVIADVAIPAALALVAQVRDRLLKAAETFAQLRVEGERARLEMIRISGEESSTEERLAARVTHLREILVWVDELPSPPDEENNRAWKTLLAACRLAHKVLADQENPKASDRTRSAVDPDARRAMHGQWYDGYLLDVMMDADSELITALDVMPANGDEGANAAELVRQEEATHGNNIQALSMDGVGFRGSVLRELEDPEGLGLDVYTPPSPEKEVTHFRPEDFSEDPVAATLTCPAGHTTERRKRNRHDSGWEYSFPRKLCADCPLQTQCLSKPLAKVGRSVNKTDYEAEYRRMRAKAQTTQFIEVRREHPKIERKLADLVRWHGVRRTRYRGRWKVLCGQLLAATVANVKRIVSLLAGHDMKVLDPV